MIERHIGVAFVVLTLISCGKGDKAIASEKATSAPPAGHGPTAAILSRWQPPADSVAYGFVDFGALLKTELLQRIQSSVMLLAQGTLTKQGNDCVTQWSRAVRQAALAGNDMEQIAIIAYDKSAIKIPFGVCVRALGGLPPINLPNGAEAYDLNGRVLAVVPDAVIVGTRGLVEASLSNGKKASWPDLLLTSDRQLVFSADNTQNKISTRGFLSVTKSTFAAHADLTFPTESAAKAVVDSVLPARIKQDFLDQSPIGDERQHDQLLEHWHVKHVQRAVAVDFSMKGSPDEMAQQLGLISAISIFGFRSYIASAKVPEARRNVRSIAEHLIAAQPKKLTSLPPVPVQFEVLQGQKYQSAPEDWSAWKPIDFAMTEPQYYQYRVEASKDGKSAQVIAEGDLNADGRRSRFLIHVTLDPKAHSIAASESIEEVDPLE